MINKSTTFILGAGSSVPYGYPTGFQLRNDIINNFPNRLKELLATSKVEQDEQDEQDDMVQKASEMVVRFRDSMNLSIDQWLSRNPEYASLGKKAIAASIMENEKEESITNTVSDGKQDWFSTLFAKMTSELTKPNDANRFKDNAVAFITFNYDRLLEHLLYQALRNSFGSVDEHEAIGILRQIRIYHVYGQIDKLPWQGGSRKYGIKYTHRDVVEAAKGIKIVSEQAPSNLDEPKSLIHSSERIFFLGFSYAAENISILELQVFLSRVNNLYGTALNLTREQIANIKGKLNVSSENTPAMWIEDCDCKKLLLNYL